jgi:hypothetical protein
MSVGLRTISFELKYVLPDISVPPTHFSLHSYTFGLHNFSFSARYHFITSGGYIENSYTQKGNYTDSTWFDFSLTPERPTASVKLGLDFSGIHLYPNPASSMLHVQLLALFRGGVEMMDASV